MAKYLGQQLLPEVAAAIEAEVFYQPDLSVDPGQFAPEEYDGLMFGVESFRAIVDELHPLHEAHFAETERARGGQELRPQYDYLFASERAGKLVQFTARAGTELIGNIRMYLFDDLHTGTLGAREDTLFVRADHRRGLRAARFTAYAEKVLAALGVADVWCDTKILFDEHGNVTRDVGVLMRRMGYAHVANRYHKRLTPPKVSLE